MGDQIPQNPTSGTTPQPDILPMAASTDVPPFNQSARNAFSTADAGGSSNQPINPVPQTPESPKPKSKLIPILVVVLILVALGAAGLWAYQNYLASPKPTQEAGLPSPTPVATTDPTVDWKTYTSSTSEVSFLYPQEMSVIEINNSIYLKSGTNNFAQVVFYEQVPNNFISPKDKQVVKIDGRDAYVTECPTGCEEGGATPIVQIDIYAKPRTQIIFYGNSSLTTIQNQILSTFEFLESADYQTEIRNTLDLYLVAYEQKDWTTVKQMLSSGVKNEFDQSIASGYNIKSHQIVSIEKNERASNAYSARVKLYDQQGNIMKLNGRDQLDFLLEQENTSWKVVTWYLFP